MPFIDANMRDKLIITTERDYEDVLQQYVDLQVLPPEISPLGEGSAVEDFDTVWKGGAIPNQEEEESIDRSENIEVSTPLSATELPKTSSQAQGKNLKGGSLRGWINEWLEDASASESGYFGHPLYML